MVANKFKKTISMAHIFIRGHKRILIISLSSVTTILLIVGFILYSYFGWNGYSDAYKKHFINAKINIDSAIAKNSKKTPTDMASKVNQISAVQAKLNGEIGSYCTLNPLIGWQGFISQLSEKAKACEYQSAKLGKLLNDIGKITEYLKSEQKLASIINVANEMTGKNNQSDKWKLIEAFWALSASDVGKLSNTSEFKPIKTLAVSKLTAVATAWKSLSAASEAKNRQQFEDSVTNLGKTYTLLKSITDSSNVEVKKLVGNLNNSYAAVFRTD